MVKASLIGLLGIILFSSKAVLVKYIYQFDVDAISLLLMRLLFALPFYVVIGLVHWRKNKNLKYKPVEFLPLVVLGIMGYYMASFLDFTGLQYISASMERLILFVYPTLVLILTRIVYKTIITPQQLLAILLTYTGIFIAFSQGAGGQKLDRQFLTGALFIFSSALTYAYYLMESGRYIPKFGPVLFTSFAMVISCICVIVHYIIAGKPDVFSFPAPVYVSALCMAVFSTVAPSFLISEAIRRIGSSNLSILGSFGPIATIILAYIFLNETITTAQMAGTAVVISGVMIINLKK
ncbi:MAG: EamA family transporter [Bacteroidetes bacterium]|nr:EamA family transporter [Bacteroidota bacterium]